MKYFMKYFMKYQASSRQLLPSDFFIEGVNSCVQALRDLSSAVR